MKMWSLCRDRDGVHVELQEVPLWAYLAQGAGDWLLEATHPLFCCADWEWAWKLAWAPPPATEKPDEDGYVYNPHTPGHVLHLVGQQLASGFGAWRRFRTKARVPVSDEWVREHFPGEAWLLAGYGDEMRAAPGDDGEVQL